MVQQDLPTRAQMEAWWRAQRCCHLVLLIKSPGLALPCPPPAPSAESTHLYPSVQTRKKRQIRTCVMLLSSKDNLFCLTPRYSPSLTLSVWISLAVFLARLWVKAFWAVILVEALRSWTDTTDMTGFQILNWMSAPTGRTPPSWVVTYIHRKIFQAEPQQQQQKELLC